jgi:hypothetical protein
LVKVLQAVKADNRTAQDMQDFAAQRAIPR